MILTRLNLTNLLKCKIGGGLLLTLILDKRLPDTEFEVMKAVWEEKPPVTTNILMEKIGGEKGWKVPTLISILNRLIKKGFLSSDKKGKERLYYPVIEKDEYLRVETENFVKEYHGNSFLSLVNTFYGEKNISDDELQELVKILNKER